jgi:dipeptidyl aminopeptidase/acylaminoacyl peptidase
MEHLIDTRFSLEFNIDGCSWLYEAELDPIHKEFSIIQVLVGEAELANGVLFSSDYDKITDQFSFSFSNAVAPTQIYTSKRTGKSVLERHTNEKVLGIPVHLLSTGEDASFISHDGTRVSARLYLPSDDLGYSGKLPLVYYIHGGPQSQERPDFAWFSMPIIQFLTLNGFALIRRSDTPIFGKLQWICLARLIC